MSYEFDMYTYAGSENRIYTDLNLNCTYNLSPMFKKAFKDNRGVNIIDGKKGRRVQKKLVLAYNNMINHFPDYQKLNPANGWGNAEGALKTLKTLHEYALRYPKAIFEIT